MKTRFSGLDVHLSSLELQRLVGLRVSQVYDVDSKTYLIKLQKPDYKAVLLLESGCRIHTTQFEWPKNPAPSGFAMKMRKHINNKRLESLTQLGTDRILDLQFGSEGAAYHLLLELYDRGNLVLTDADYTILHLLRPRVHGEDRFLARETYPKEEVVKACQGEGMTKERAEGMLFSKQPTDTLKKVFTPHFEFGPALLEHMLLARGLRGNMKLNRDITDPSSVAATIAAIFSEARAVVSEAAAAGGGVILQKKETVKDKELVTFTEFHPMLLRQHEETLHKRLDTFDGAVDEFFSSLESQKIELKTLQFEKQAMKKLENVEKDHKQRIVRLQLDQEVDRRRAELIEMNESLVTGALTVMRSALANQIDWKDIQELVDEATANGDPVASLIKGLKLETNHFTMLLKDPYAFYDEEDSDQEDDGIPNELLVDIDLDLSAQANARRFYSAKKSARHKLEKTEASHSVAMKSAEKKTKESLKEAAAITNIIKARKTFWFEKFFWFISSENYLVIGGRDMQQNEILVKRYLRAGDVYVHADLHGASSVVVKNQPGAQGKPIPPKTLNEAGHMAVCYSAAWENKVVAAAWWVDSTQVSKTAPSGEYLTAGSFMIRGKKNFLLPAPLVLGFGFLFKLEDGSVERHKGERRVRTLEEEDEEAVDDPAPMMDTLALEDVEEDEKEEDEEEGKEAFPDTTIDVGLESGKVVARGVSQVDSEPAEPEEIIRFVSKTKKKTQVNHAKAKQEKKKAKKGGKILPDSDPEEEPNESQKKKPKDDSQKRGKKGKMKKMKEKYKDQDEEEKELRMKILHGDKKKDQKKEEEEKTPSEKKEPTSEKREEKRPPPKKPQENNASEEPDAEVEEEERASETDMLDTLTGAPVPEDELLFAVPVVAPYQTLVGYKYKVKITPGTGKRGKATKTALNAFTVDRATPQREKDLFKSVKDQDLARNLPGKVKLNITSTQKSKITKARKK